MRPRALSSLLAATASLAACATAPSATPGRAAPVPIDGYDWILHRDGDDARLSYGVAESDDVRLALDCARGAGSVALTVLAGPDAAPEIVLESGGETESFIANSEEDLLHDGLILTAEADADSPIFQRFRRTGWLAARRGGTLEVYATHPGSGERVDGFFDFCGRDARSTD